MRAFFIRIETKQIANQSKLLEWLASFADGKYFIRADNYKRRSLQQNAYLHAVLIPLFREGLNKVGYDEIDSDEKTKEVMKQLFLKKQIVNHETGEVIEYVQNTSELTTMEMNLFYERVWKYAAENLETIIPSPGQQSFLNI